VERGELAVGNVADEDDPAGLVRCHDVGRNVGGYPEERQYLAESVMLQSPRVVKNDGTAQC
jgi:hypothetical protein